MPRLSLFNGKYPEIEVRISTTMRVVDFEQEDIDLAIRHGQGDWPGLASDFLFAVETLPVCSPVLLFSNTRIECPSDLSQHILLPASARADDWRGWLAQAGVPDLEPRRNLTFEKTNFALAAAMKGIGVAISDRHIVAEDLQSGRLVAPFTQTMNHDTGYYLVYPRGRIDHPKVRLFRDWL